MAESPIFYLAPPLRCFHANGPTGNTQCGRLAVAQHTIDGMAAPIYLCWKHSEAGDALIAPDALVCRVRLHACIDVAAVSWNGSVGRAEAVSHIETAIMAAGGCLNILDVTTITGRRAGLVPAYARRFDGGAPFPGK